MTIPRLAVRNLLRNPRRTLLTLVAIFAGVALVIVGRGLIAGMEESIIVGATDTTVGHVLARPAGYPTEGQQFPVTDLLELTPQARSLLDAQALAWTERLYFAPVATHGAESLRVMAVGLDAVRDERVFPRALWKVEGALPEEGSSDIAMSPRLAQLLGVRVGDTLVLQVRTHKGALNALEVRVAGVVRTSNALFDLRSIQVPMSLAKRLVSADTATHVSARLASRDDAPRFAATLAGALGPAAEVVTWQQETEELIRL
ncbi:MAG: ABC transporter permease, partial [Myxococcales bacterium]